MLQSVKENFVVLDELLMGTDFQDLMFTKREKQGILQILEFLEPFKGATDALQGEHYPTLSLVTPAVDELIQVCRPAERTQRNDRSQLNIEDDDIVEQSGFDHDQEVGYLGLPMDDPNRTEEDFGLEELKSKVSSALHRRFPQNLIFKLASALDYRLKGDPSVIGTLPEFMEELIISMLFSNYNKMDPPVIHQIQLKNACLSLKLVQQNQKRRPGTALFSRNVTQRDLAQMHKTLLPIETSPTKSTATLPCQIPRKKKQRDWIS